MGTRAEVNKVVVYYLKDERVKGAPLRSASVGEGDGHITAVSIILGDGDRLPNAYIYASQGQNVQPAVMCGPYLPGLDWKHMSKVFFSSTVSGFIDLALFKMMLITFYIPLWRNKFPTGPLLLIADFPEVHRFDADLAVFFFGAWSDVCFSSAQFKHAASNAGFNPLWCLEEKILHVHRQVAGGGS